MPRERGEEAFAPAEPQEKIPGLSPLLRGVFELWVCLSDLKVKLGQVLTDMPRLNGGKAITWGFPLEYREHVSRSDHLSIWK